MNLPFPELKMDLGTVPPPAKRIATSDYRYCPHCMQTVSKRTYRKHMALPSTGFDSAQAEDSGGLTTEVIQVASEAESSGAMSFQASEQADLQYSNDDTAGDHVDIEETDHDETSEEFLADFELDSSGSEYDDAESSEMGVQLDLHPAALEKDEQSHALVRWFVIFISIWQAMFVVSDLALGVLLHFVSGFLRILAHVTSSPILMSLAVGIPGTVHKLKTYVHGDSDSETFVKYVVCPSCYTLYTLEECFSVSPLGERIPRKCSKVQFPNHPQRNRRLPCGTFLLTKVHLSDGNTKFVPRYTYCYQPIQKALQRLLYRPGFVETLEHWRSRECKEDFMSDVYDGRVWQEFSSEKYAYFLKNKRSYGLMLNFDFFQPYKHVTDSYGVFYMTFLNLPRDQRFRRENVLLVGIIPAFEHEPSNLNSFMEPFVAELKEFWNPGVRLFTANSPKFRVLFKLALMCVACDIPAARKVGGFMGHGASFGCSRCLKHFPGSVNEKLNYSGFDRERWPARDLDSHRATCQKLKTCNTLSQRIKLESETGIRYSVLIDLPYFNPIQFVIVDPMHNLFLGTAKRMMKIWTEKNLVTKHRMIALQDRVDSIRVPCDIGRIPRKIASSFSGFTADQWKNWVTIYSMFALRDVLPSEHYVCWQAFVLSCFYLCRKEISSIQLKKADLLILKFCAKIQELYGDLAVTPNMHLHCHLAECVKDYGPIYGFWLFPFERYNGILGNFPTNKKNSSEQLMRRFIYEMEYTHLPKPNLFKDLEALIPQTKNTVTSTLHQNTLEAMSKNCLDLQAISFPTVAKFSMLETSDMLKLREVYIHIYNTAQLRESAILRTIKVYKTITYYNQRLGSFRSSTSSNSAFIMANWSDDNGYIDTNSILRPGRVLYYFMHSHEITDQPGKQTDHIFAAVYWYKEHADSVLNSKLKPLSVWKNDFVPEGPAMFIPVNCIVCRCVKTQTMIAGSQDLFVFVSPITGFKFF